jgi:hypothetical protein
VDEVAVSSDFGSSKGRDGILKVSAILNQIVVIGWWFQNYFFRSIGRI